MYGVEWSASSPGGFNQWQRAPNTHLTGDWLGPKGGLDYLGEERNLLLLLGIELRFLCRSARCVVTTPSKLSQLPFLGGKILRLFLYITLPDRVSLKARQRNILDRMASDINITMSLYVTSCILADRYQRFLWTVCLYHLPKLFVPWWRK
jgi:hypothetical protein